MRQGMGDVWRSGHVRVDVASIVDVSFPLQMVLWCVGGGDGWRDC